MIKEMRAEAMMREMAAERAGWANRPRLAAFSPAIGASLPPAPFRRSYAAFEQAAIEAPAAATRRESAAA
jgi:hypothetical protein